MNFLRKKKNTNLFHVKPCELYYYRHFRCRTICRGSADTGANIPNSLHLKGWHFKGEQNKIRPRNDIIQLIYIIDRAGPIKQKPGIILTYLKRIVTVSVSYIIYIYVCTREYTKNKYESLVSCFRLVGEYNII